MSQLVGARSTLAEIRSVSARAASSGDVDLEARVVRLRYELGQDLLDMAERLEPGAISPIALGVADPFPSVGAEIPEISLVELDVGLLRGALAHHGCLLVHGFFEPDACAILRDDIDRMADGFARWMATRQQELTPPWWLPFSAPGVELPLALRNMCGPVGTFYAADGPRPFRHMIEAFDESGLPALLAEYMREPSLLGLEKTSLRRVPHEVPNAWHQDGWGFGRERGLVNVWVSLGNCGVDAPTLAVVPKRLSEILPPEDGSLVPWEIDPAALRRAAGDVAEVELILGPGDAVLFDEMLAHTTRTRETMTKRRYCADAWFFPVSAFPRHMYEPLVYSVP